MAKGNGFLKYDAYFFNTTDPVLDLITSLKRNSGLSNREIRDKGGPAVATLGNWDKKKVRRPQFATVAATGGALGLTSLPITSEGRQKLKAR